MCSPTLASSFITSGLQQVNNINQPLEITAISSPEASLKSSPAPYQDHDLPPVLKKEKPLSASNGVHYSPLTSEDEAESEEEMHNTRIERKNSSLCFDSKDSPQRIEGEKGLSFPGRKSSCESVGKWKSTFSPISDTAPVRTPDSPSSPSHRCNHYSSSDGARRGSSCMSPGSTNGFNDHTRTEVGKATVEGNLFLSKTLSSESKRDDRGPASRGDRSNGKSSRSRERDGDGGVGSNLFMAQGGILNGKGPGQAPLHPHHHFLSSLAAGSQLALHSGLSSVASNSVLQSLFSSMPVHVSGTTSRLANSHSMANFTTPGVTGGTVGGAFTHTELPALPHHLGPRSSASGGICTTTIPPPPSPSPSLQPSPSIPSRTSRRTPVYPPHAMAFLPSVPTQLANLPSFTSSSGHAPWRFLGMQNPRSAPLLGVKPR
ncbi:histone-lysine N-methyltransferase, H3 lysine-79 specific [Discoglossus pictus]